MEEIRLKLRAFITDNFLFGRSDERLSDEDSLIENGVIDSTGVLQLVSFLERDCGVHVEDDEIVPDNLDSLSKLTAFICRKLNLTERIASTMHDVRPALATASAGTVIVA
jgi:acyl carrier protein